MVGTSNQSVSEMAIDDLQTWTADFLCSLDQYRNPSQVALESCIGLADRTDIICFAGSLFGSAAMVSLAELSLMTCQSLNHKGPGIGLL